MVSFKRPLREVPPSRRHAKMALCGSRPSYSLAWGRDIVERPRRDAREPSCSPVYPENHIRYAERTLSGQPEGSEMSGRTWSHTGKPPESPLLSGRQRISRRHCAVKRSLCVLVLLGGQSSLVRYDHERKVRHGASRNDNETDRFEKPPRISPSSSVGFG